ncbi:hypothetical protein WH47_01196 [Habropoda laboriosa]|uniref:Endonuclease/exonuclease/phosphatase domain-containing protein n=1 Tax=Habropoda laboriosa TaxID=597456 RepID=A0A0L7QZ31_9HYME|nr:hypothetical protein WH47_01196 [Habropoda laboriosa]
MSRTSGGLCILYQPKIVKEVKIIKISDAWVCIKAKVNQKEYIICNICIKSSNAEHSIVILGEILKEIKEEYHILVAVGGDFNAGIGNYNQIEEILIEGTTFSNSRKAEDKLLNRADRILCDTMEELSLIILNGRSQSDKEALERKISVRASRDELVQKGILLPVIRSTSFPENETASDSPDGQKPPTPQQTPQQQQQQPNVGGIGNVGGGTPAATPTSTGNVQQSQQSQQVASATPTPTTANPHSTGPPSNQPSPHPSPLYPGIPQPGQPNGSTQGQCNGLNLKEARLFTVIGVRPPIGDCACVGRAALGVATAHAPSEKKADGRLANGGRGSIDFHLESLPKARDEKGDGLPHLLLPVKCQHECRRNEEPMQPMVLNETT